MPRNMASKILFGPGSDTDPALLAAWDALSSDNVSCKGYINALASAQTWQAVVRAMVAYADQHPEFASELVRVIWYLFRAGKSLPQEVAHAQPPYFAGLVIGSLRCGIQLDQKGASAEVVKSFQSNLLTLFEEAPFYENGAEEAAAHVFQANRKAEQELSHAMKTWVRCKGCPDRLYRQERIGEVRNLLAYVDERLKRTYSSVQLTPFTRAIFNPLCYAVLGSLSCVEKIRVLAAEKS